MLSITSEDNSNPAKTRLGLPTDTPLPNSKNSTRELDSIGHPAQPNLETITFDSTPNDWDSILNQGNNDGPSESEVLNNLKISARFNPATTNVKLVDQTTSPRRNSALDDTFSRIQTPPTLDERERYELPRLTKRIQRALRETENAEPLATIAYYDIPAYRPKTQILLRKYENRLEAIVMENLNIALRFKMEWGNVKIALPGNTEDYKYDDKGLPITDEEGDPLVPYKSVEDTLLSIKDITTRQEIDRDICRIPGVLLRTILFSAPVKILEHYGIDPKQVGITPPEQPKIKKNIEANNPGKIETPVYTPRFSGGTNPNLDRGVIIDKNRITIPPIQQPVFETADEYPNATKTETAILQMMRILSTDPSIPKDFERFVNYGGKQGILHYHFRVETTNTDTDINVNRLIVAQEAPAMTPLYWQTYNLGNRIMIRKKVLGVFKTPRPLPLQVPGMDPKSYKPGCYSQSQRFSIYEWTRTPSAVKIVQHDGKKRNEGAWFFREIDSLRNDLIRKYGMR